MKHRRNFKGRRLTPYERKAMEPMPCDAPENKMESGEVKTATLGNLKVLAEVVKGQLDDMRERLDEATIEQRRPIIADPNAPIVKASLPREWDDYLRKGHTHALEEKALSAGSNPEGGYLVPQVLEGRIRSVARDSSNIRTIADVQSITGGSLDIFLDPDDIGSAWVGEMGARPETTAPNLKRITIPVHEIYAMPKATQTLLDDSAVNIEEWVSTRVADVLGRQENAAFVNGNGVAKPRGFLTYTTVAEASWAWEKIGYIATGQATFDAASPADDLIDLVYSLKTEYRANASWVMNSATAGIVRKMKDAEERYIWQQSLAAGQPNLLLGFPVVMAEDMPDLGDGNFPIAFGDFRRGYTIVDRIGIRVLRDPYSNKPFILFYTTKRVGGGVTDFNAIKLLKTANR
jgi:HK97 family phage major capsid protein